MSYIKEKRESIGKCNICGKTAKLTWDHVPPKFCFNNQRTQYNSLFEVSQGEKYNLVAQNGIKYRTLCGECNNTLLGSNYDIEYKKLVDFLYNIYTTPSKIPQIVEIQEVPVNKIARAIVGHLLAARKDYFMAN